MKFYFSDSISLKKYNDKRHNLYAIETRKDRLSLISLFGSEYYLLN